METNQYDFLFNIVRNELNIVDPIGIICDKDKTKLVDEYDIENREIIPLINKYDDHKQFANKICEIFIKSTEIKFSAEMFYECAKNILKKSKNNT